jgi:hypothetical protein
MTRSRPILMSTPMVKALLDGRKVQTRRIIKPQPEFDGGWWKLAGAAWSERVSSIPCVPGHSLYNACPYGKRGEVLWVREAFQLLNSPIICPGDVVQRACIVQGKPVLYRADLEDVGLEGWGKWRPSIHMPRWASRLTLELTEVRVERLQDISEEDAIAEGMRPLGKHDVFNECQYADAGFTPSSAREAFEWIWNSINGPNSWSENPFVWCLSFKVHKQNVDTILKEAA